MSIQVFGMQVSRGVAIGRAVLVASSRIDVAHYFVAVDRIEAEIERLGLALDTVAAELEALKVEMPADAPAELPAMIDVHLLLLHDETFAAATRGWVRERHYNAEWALSAQFEVLARQFDEMEDAYLRERKADVEQVVERLLRELGRSDRQAPAGRRLRRATLPARTRWCWSRPTSRRRTCCSSSAACSRVSSPRSADAPRTPRSSRAAWTSRPWWERARRAG
jgi:phosphotransferase system enzyme I (PtsI)